MPADRTILRSRGHSSECGWPHRMVAQAKSAGVRVVEVRPPSRCTRRQLPLCMHAEPAPSPAPTGHRPPTASIAASALHRRQASVNAVSLDGRRVAGVRLSNGEHIAASGPTPAMPCPRHALAPSPCPAGTCALRVIRSLWLRTVECSIRQRSRAGARVCVRARSWRRSAARHQSDPRECAPDAVWRGACAPPHGDAHLRGFNGRL